MPLFQYKAIMPNGQIENGSIELQTRQDVLAYLEANNAIPVAINIKDRTVISVQDVKKLFGGNNRKNTIPLIDITNGLGMLLRAGLPLDRALKSIAMASSNPAESAFLLEIESEIREGRSFSDALEKRKAIVGDLYVSMVRAGEVSGRLDESVSRLATHLEQAKTLKDNIITAMLYPLVLLTVTLVSIVILMVMVMPRFKQLFDDMGGEVPAVTQLFINISEFMSHHGMTAMFVILVLLLLANFLNKKPSVSIWLDRQLLNLPWYGPLLEKVQMTRFAQTLSLLLRNGVSIQKSIEISRGVISNSFIETDIKTGEKRLGEGESFSATIGKRFPNLTQQMIKIGEEASELENTLEYVADIAQQEVDRNIKRVMGIMEPVIIVVLGIVVAAVIGSIMVAVLSMNDLVVM